MEGKLNMTCRVNDTSVFVNFKIAVSKLTVLKFCAQMIFQIKCLNI